MIFTRAYWQAAAERAISAGAAAATAGATVADVGNVHLGTLRAGALAFGVGAGFSVLKGLAANALNNGLGPGFGSAEVTPPAVVLPAEDGEPRGPETAPAAEVVIDAPPEVTGGTPYPPTDATPEATPAPSESE